jgi:ubiquinone biosynthesis protein
VTDTGALVRTATGDAAETAPPVAPSAPPPSALPPATDAARLAATPTVRVFDPLAPYRGTVRRFFTVYRHVIGLLAGGAVSYVDALPREQRRGLGRSGRASPRSSSARSSRASCARCRSRCSCGRRLELLGPTYIKFGQILAIREDLLPEPVTRELQNLFDRLPAIPFPRCARSSSGRSACRSRRCSPRSRPSPSAARRSRRRTSRRLATGERVVVKVIKPGIAEIIDYDLRLLAAVGGLLERVSRGTRRGR